MQTMDNAHELARPLFIKSEEGKGVTGIAWANVDATCTLNYQVRTERVRNRIRSTYHLNA